MRNPASPHAERLRNNSHGYSHPFASTIIMENIRQTVVREIPRKPKKGRKIILIISVIIILISLSIIFLSETGSIVMRLKGSTSPYKAVFLDNNQVYFGKVTNKNSKYVKLTDVYYLQVTQPSQNQYGALSQPDLTLIKLGEELHGPKDEMEILRDHIMYIEELTNDSRVVQAIREYSDQ